MNYAVVLLGLMSAAMATLQQLHVSVSDTGFNASVPAVFFYAPHKSGSTLIAELLAEIAKARDSCHYRTLQYSRSVEIKITQQSELLS